MVAAQQTSALATMARSSHVAAVAAASPGKLSRGTARHGQVCPQQVHHVRLLTQVDANQLSAWWWLEGDARGLGHNAGKPWARAGGVEEDGFAAARTSRMAPLQTLDPGNNKACVLAGLAAFRFLELPLTHCLGHGGDQRGLAHAGAALQQNGLAQLQWRVWRASAVFTVSLPSSGTAAAGCCKKKNNPTLSSKTF